MSAAWAELQTGKRSFRSVPLLLSFFNDENLFDFSLINEECNESKSRQLNRSQDTSEEEKIKRILFRIS